MVNKKPRSRSIDGFIPRSATTKAQIGFVPPTGMERMTRTPKPAAPNKAAPFPGVGMTLPKYDSFGLGSALPSDVPEKKSRWARLRSKKTLKRVGLSLLVVVLLGGGWLGFKFIYNTSKIFKGNILGILSTTKLSGENVGRVNILVAGNSSDDPGHDGADLTDSIMVVSIDTKDNTAILLSIPRDLWVDIPGFGYSKINAAYPDGQSENFSEAGYFLGGMGLLQEVVQQDLGLTMNYYALVNYGAFKDAVNAVGGITVNIQSSDPRGLYDPSVDYSTHGPLVKLTNGEHTLTGEQALDLARARGDAYGSYGFPQSDFNRTQNQRLMIVALKTKALTTGVLANPIKLTSLFDAIGNNVQTDFNLSQVRRLYDIGKNISNANIQSVGLNNVNGKDLLANYDAADGEDALIPAAGIDDYSAIDQYLTQITSNDPVVREGATVVVLNATNTNGLAASASKTLTTKGLNVLTMADATGLQATTTVIDASNNSKPATKAYLDQLYKTTPTTTNPYAATYSADFIVILGQDQVPATTPTNQ